MKYQNAAVSQKYKTQYILVGTAVLAAMFVVMFFAARPKPQYELHIKELGGTSMLALSQSEELGIGEILLIYGNDMVVKDVNGQIISNAELSIEDRIKVEIAPREKDSESGRLLDPVIDTIILLPTGSDEFV